MFTFKMNMPHAYTYSLLIILVTMTIVVPECSGEVYNSVEKMQQSVEFIKHSEFYEKLQNTIVRYIVHFQEFDAMRIDSKWGYLDVPLDSEIDSTLDKFQEYVLQLEFNRANVNDRFLNIDHPINAFRFLRNNTVVLDKIINHVNETFENLRDIDNKAKLKFALQFQTNENFPTHQDFNNAMAAIINIQNIHLIPTEEIANGKIFEYGLTPLTAQECVDLAQAARAINMTSTVLWLETARNRVENHGDTSVDRIWLINKIIETYSFWGCHCITEANQLRQTLQSMDPTATNKMADKDQKCRKNTKRLSCMDFLNSFSDGMKKQKHGNMITIDKSCREVFKKGGNSLSNKKINGIKRGNLCYFETNNNPSLLLGPLKMEVYSTTPFIAKVHEFVGKWNVRNLVFQAYKELIKPKNVLGITKLSLTDPMFPIENVYLSRKGNEQVKILQNKMAATANSKSLKNNRKLSVINFGTGRIYKPTQDFLKIQQKKMTMAPNVSLTSIFINLTDQEGGGELVFPNLGLNIKTDKRAAILVKTEFTNGVGDPRATHTFCPIVSGSKWIGSQHYWT